MKEAIKKELSRLQFSNGQPVFEAVQTKEEAFSGPFVERASDLIVPVNHTHAPPKTEEWDFVLTLPNISGAHSPEGIFVASGKGIMKGKAFQRAQIIDMAPTILYIFHEPVPEDTDGEVLLHIFDPDFKKNRRITRKGSSISFKPEKKVFSDEEEEQVEQKLRDLGYIG